jgi:hypothetical protein
MSATSPGGPLRVVLWSGSTTTADGTSQWINVAPYSNLTLWLTTHGNPGAGTVLLEECDYDPRTQTPPSQTTSAIVTVDVDVSVGTDGQYAYHAPTGRSYSFVRARIGTSVTVATLDAVLTAS